MHKKINNLQLDSHENKGENIHIPLTWRQFAHSYSQSLRFQLFYVHRTRGEQVSTLPVIFWVRGKSIWNFIKSKTL